jgi:glycosyltransferase involved in cell wall biosynthesis
MLRVAVITSVHPRFDVRIFHRECKTLVGAGYHVTLIAPGTDSKVVDGVELRGVPGVARRLSRMSLTVWRVYREAANLNADVYHFHDPELIPVGLLLRLRGKTVIYDAHEDLPLDIASSGKYYLPRWARGAIARVAEAVETAACRWFSAVVAATPAIGTRLRPYSREVVVIQNFPRRGELLGSGSGQPWSERELAVAYVGCLSPERGLFEMISAIGLVAERLHVSLKLAGQYDPPWARDRARSLSGWRFVDELGFLDRPAVAHLLSRVRAGLVLFHSEPSHVEAQPNKLFEYMCAGIPVIASDFPLWREIVQGADCGLLVDPRDPQAIAQAIEYVLTHSKEAECMGRRGREAVECRYNWENEEAKLLGLYQRVARSR